VKYPPGFAHYVYANPQAVQGSVRTLASPGSFNKLNPFSLKGRAQFPGMQSKPSYRWGRLP